MRDLANRIQRLVDLMVTENLTTATQQQHIVAMAMATAVAYKLPLPTGPVDSVKSWYMTNAFTEASATVGGFNERYLPVDVAVVMTMVSNIWNLRYDVLHNPNSQSAIHATYESIKSADNTIAPIYRQLVDDARGSKFYATMISLMHGSIDDAVETGIATD